MSEHANSARNGHPVAILALLCVFGLFLLAIGSGFTLAKNDTHLYVVDGVNCIAPGNSSYSGYCVVPGGVTSMFNDAYANLTIWGGLFLVAAMAGLIVWAWRRDD